MGRTSNPCRTLIPGMLVCAMVCGCDREVDPVRTVNDTNPAEIEIREMIGALPRLVDDRHWSAIEEFYDEQVTADYTSLFGGKPEISTGRSMVEDWRGALAPMDATQHLMGPINVRVNGNFASAQCHVRAWHYAEGAPGGKEWMVAGSYDFGLRQTPNGWKISNMRLNTYYQTGNTNLVKEAKELNRH